MSDILHISEHKAMMILTRDGDFTHDQARAVLMHSRKQSYEGGNYYPLAYITQRATDNAAREA